MRGLRERLVAMSEIHKRYSEQGKLIERIEQAQSPRDALLIVRDSLFGDNFSEAPFWTLREVVKMDL